MTLKRINKPYIFVYILFSILLFSCSDQHAGTNTSETQNALEVSLVLSNGTPASLARVQIVNVEQWKLDAQQGKTSVPTIQYADQNGQLVLQLDSTNSSKKYALWIDQKNGEGLFKAIDSVTTQEKKSTWVLGKFASHKLLLQSSIATPHVGKTLHLLGTPRTATSDSNGLIVFDSLPPGIYTPIEQDTWLPLGSASLFVESGKNNQSPDSLLLVSNSILLDNFDDGDALSYLSQWTNSSVWWSYRADSNTTMTPHGLVPISSALLNVEQGAYEGLSMRVQVQHGNNVVDPVAMVGINLGDGVSGVQTQFTWADFSHVTLIRFWAKGTAQIQVLFKTQIVDELGDHHHYNYFVNLTPTWKLYEIHRDSIVPYPNSLAAKAQIPYAEASKRVSAILFQTFTENEFWIDNLEAEGLEWLQFHPNRPLAE